MVKSLKIGANRYQITVKDVGDIWGHCDATRQRIYIDPSAKGKQRAATLLHESIHAAIKEYGIGEYLSHEAEEMMVRTLEVAVCNILMENKAFTRQLVKALEA